MIKNLLERWPLIRQIQTGADGTGPEAMSERTKNLSAEEPGCGLHALALSLLRRRLRADGLSQRRLADLD